MELPIHKEQLIETSQEKISAHYFFEGKALGEGSYGIVRKARRISDNQKFAVKIIPKRRIKRPEVVAREVDLMKQADHPNVARLNASYEDARYIYLVLDYCKGGELFDVLTTLGHFSEQRAGAIFEQMLSSVAYLHSIGIVHRDLKPENFLFSGHTITSPLKLIDFGIAKKFDPDHLLTTKTGTFYYISPDILSGHYDEKCDVWSLGVILFMMLAGYPPFDGENNAQILESVQEGAFSFDDPAWDNVSHSAKELICRMLDPCSHTRISAQEALEHPWLRSHSHSEHVQIPCNWKQLQEYQQSNQLRKAVLNYMATQCSNDELNDLVALFQDIDTDHLGMISVQELRTALAQSDCAFTPELEKFYAGNKHYINLTEFVAAMLDRRLYMKEDKLWQAFQRFDVHHTGKITAEELREVIDSEHQVEDLSVWRQLVEEVDLDGDGMISYLDFISMMESANKHELGSLNHYMQP